ncbi:MAG: 3-hydroxyacyl-ACP dehydratase FabZ [Clostridia bacterium]
MDVKSILPHREPFLFVDEIMEVSYRKYSKGIKTVRSDEFWIHGHFPGDPVFPGALLMETMAQVGGLLLVSGEGHTKNEYNAYLSKVNDLKFLKKVIPGDTIVSEGNFLEQAGNFVKVQTKAFVNGSKVAEATITYVILKKL